jgi:predicted HTH domain antitoxin
MPVTISDQDLRAMSMSERDARVEIACRLFEAGKLSFGHAARLADLSDELFLAELDRRSIPRYRYTEGMLAQDLQALEHMRQQGKAGE